MSSQEVKYSLNAQILKQFGAAKIFSNRAHFNSVDFRPDGEMMVDGQPAYEAEGLRVGVFTPGANVAVGAAVGVLAGAGVAVGSSPPHAASTSNITVPRTSPLDQADHRIAICILPI